jgi:hypothetical protein
MLRVTLPVLVVAWSIALGGCSMCCGPFDFDYPMFQTRYARVDPQYGRVGSIFSDPNADPGVYAPTNADAPPEGNDDQELELPESELPDNQIDPFRGIPEEELEIPDEESPRTTGWGLDGWN